MDTEKLFNIERLRVLAAIGIVWFHTGQLPGRSIGYAGLPIFILIFFMLIGMKGYEATGTFFNKKFRRLIIPWLIWSAIYLVYQIGKFLIKKESVLEPYMLITGPALHLWYLPYAFGLAMVSNQLQKTVSFDSRKFMLLSGIAVTFILCLVVSVLCNEYSFRPPLSQWLYGLTACPAGWTIGRILSSNDSQKSKLLVFFFCLTLSAGCLILTFLGYDFLGVSYIVGFFLFGLAIVLPNWKKGDVLVRWAPLTFGIYLIHPLINGALSLVLPQLVTNGFLEVILIVILSALATWLYMRYTNHKKVYCKISGKYMSSQNVDIC